MIEETVSEDSTVNPDVTEQPDQTDPDTQWPIYQFQEVGMTVSTPPEMKVSGELLDDSTFTLYIEQGAYPAEDYYQLYGLYDMNPNYDPKSINIEASTDGLEPSSITEGSVSGYKSVSGQNKGQRNRFVTYVFTDKGILTLSTSEPTPENEKLTAKILKTMEIE